MDHELLQWISKAKRGDKEAFTQLVTRYKGDVFRHAYGMLGDRMEAEDISQEAFVKAYYALPRLSSEYAFTSWMTRIVSNLCYDALKKKSRRKVVSHDHMDEHMDTNDSMDSVKQKNMQLIIEEAMQKLSFEHREVIILREIHGYAYDEMAAILRIPVGTVKSRLNKARLTLRNEISVEER